MEKAQRAGADAVIFDLEDAVPQHAKAQARQLVSRVIADPREETPDLYVRVNGARSGCLEEDILAVAGSGLAGIRLPKTESADEVMVVDALLTDAERRAGLPAGTFAIVCNVESALGVWKAEDIASASSRVIALGFGAADFAADLGVAPTDERTESLWARHQLVLASRVAGVGPPVDSVHPRIGDDEGLARTTREARAMGFFGRSAIHPGQIPIINDVFTPSADELRRAREIVGAFREASTAGKGALRLSDGSFVDLAVVRRAEDLLRLAQDLGATIP